jgi:hypothetical protein
VPTSQDFKKIRELIAELEQLCKRGRRSHVPMPRIGGKSTIGVPRAQSDRRAFDAAATADLLTNPGTREDSHN